MLRTVFVLSALMVAVPAGAATYSAKLAVPASGRVIARDIVWNCGPDACQGATDESRPRCSASRWRSGRAEFETFIVNGRSVGPAELVRCNASAKPPETSNLAAQ